MSLGFLHAIARNENGVRFIDCCYCWHFSIIPSLYHSISLSHFFNYMQFAALPKPWLTTTTNELPKQQKIHWVSLLLFFFAITNFSSLVFSFAWIYCRIHNSYFINTVYCKTASIFVVLDYYTWYLPKRLVHRCDRQSKQVLCRIRRFFHFCTKNPIQCSRAY